MLLRTLAFAIGVSFAALAAQFPEFSQQYTQRLAGKVDELQRFVREFDLDASAVGVSREQALIDLARGGAIGAQRAQTIVSTIDREKRLNSVLNDLRNAGPIKQIMIVNNSVDKEIARGTLQDFHPALPVSFEGVAFALVGFIAGISSVGLIGAAFQQINKRRKRYALSRTSAQAKQH